MTLHLATMSEFDDEGEDYGDGDDDEDFDCHLDAHGYCGKAGSEECEFDCPYSGRVRGRKPEGA